MNIYLLKRLEFFMAEQDIPKTDEPAAEAPAQGGVGELEALREAVEAERARADENWDKLLRTQAEMDNLRKRTERELENAHKYALERFAGELLAVRDSLEMGIQAAGDAEAQQLKEGSELTLKLLTQVMEKFGIQAVDPAGEKFDPERHQAMSMQESAEVPPNTVVAVMQKGYTLNDRLLRPAMVMVSKAPADS